MAMLSKTLQDGLNNYGIGAKLRALRLKKKLGLVDLGKHTGLSAALLSKIERGRLFPTLPTLLRIALVFDVGLEYFFAGTREQPLVAVTRRKQRVELPERPGVREGAYRFASLDYAATERRFNCYYSEFFPVAPGSLRPHDHPGVEFIYVIRGRLSVHMLAEEHVLEAGDAIYFDATIPHAYRRSGGRLCSAVVVTAC
jgi:transcriptional regulator with XRE-family HTH domain